MADLTGPRRWVADPTVLLLLLLPAVAWASVRALAGDPLPALALAALVAAIALSGST